MSVCELCLCLCVLYNACVYLCICVCQKQCAMFVHILHIQLSTNISLACLAKTEIVKYG